MTGTTGNKPDARDAVPRIIPVENCQVYENLPDGRYDARLENAQYKLSRNGNPMVIYEFVITQGFFQRRHIWKYSVVKYDPSFILEDASRLGIAADSMYELIAELPAARGASADITLKTSMYRGRQTQLVYLNTPEAPDE